MPVLKRRTARCDKTRGAVVGQASSAKERGKFTSFIIKERQSLPVVNYYFIVFNANDNFIDRKKGAEQWKKLKAVLHPMRKL